MAGKRVWEKDLGKQSTRNGFGEGSSPALHGDTLVINWDHEGEDFIVALDKKTGDERWRQKRDEPTTWTTPLVVEHAGRAQVVVAGSNRVRSYDLATGKEVWHCRGLTQNVIPTPVAADGVVYLTSGFRGAALLAVKLGREGDLTGTDAILWTHEKGTPYVPSPLLADGKLYLFSGNNGILSAFDVKTGKVLIDTQRIDLSNVYASPVAAGGRLYFVGRDGTSLVMRHSGDKLEEVATNELSDPIDASPAVVGKELFLRGRENLYCIAASNP
jgi:outer membrane protein assembly factor BamB